jgi:hypothetical protein
VHFGGNKQNTINEPLPLIEFDGKRKRRERERELES